MNLLKSLGAGTPLAIDPFIGQLFQRFPWPSVNTETGFLKKNWGQKKIRSLVAGHDQPFDSVHWETLHCLSSDKK